MTGVKMYINTDLFRRHLDPPPDAGGGQLGRRKVDETTCIINQNTVNRINVERN